jgi:CRP/FNR family transcriptional regulator
MHPRDTRLTSLYPVITQLPDAVKLRCLSEAREATVPAGTIVFDAGQACSGFPFVLSGSIRVVKCSESGRELPLYRVSPGESCLITSGCLLGHSQYNARGIAESETTLLLLGKDCFEQLLAFPAFRDFVFNLVSERMADLMQLVEEVAFRKLDQRLASLLLGKGRTLHTTHQALADELGSVREMVSRLLKGFAEQGWVKLSREQIEILDPAALRDLAE